MKDTPLIIAGSGRSGTTWVLDVIAETYNLRTIYEPLNPKGVPEALNFGNLYLNENEDAPELKIFFSKLFGCEINSIWTNTRILPNRMRLSIKNLYNYDYIHHMAALYKTFFIRYRLHVKQRSMRPITKFIRANLMLDWIERNFKAKIVFVVRHPGAVAASRINAAKFKGGVDWDFKGMCMQKILSQYKRDENLRKDFLDKYYEIFSNKLSNVEGQTLLWCIENIMPIYKQQRKKRYVFFYEDLVKNPNTEFEKMIKILGLKRKTNRSEYF